MLTLTLSDGRTLQAYMVTQLAPPAQIHIYPADMDIGQIYEAFDDPSKTREITVEPEDGEPTVLRHFTDLFSVQRSGLHPEKREYMVWLNYSEPAEEETK